MDVTNLLPQLAGGGTMVVMGYGGHMLIEYIKQRRAGLLEEKKLDIAEDTAQITDAAAANAILRDTLLAAQGEIRRKDERIELLETRNAEKDAKIEGLQQVVRELRAQVHILSQRLDGVDLELDDLRDNR